MILATVGTQLPFDRLMRLLDTAAAGLDEPVIAQTGKGTYRPAHMECHVALAPAAFEDLLKEARVVVAHAGIGTVLMARKHGRPLIIFPRSAALKEHRNDHQAATAAALEGRPGIYVARDEASLLALLSRPLDPPEPGENANLDRFNHALAEHIRKR